MLCLLNFRGLLVLMGRSPATCAWLGFVGELLQAKGELGLVGEAVDAEAALLAMSDCLSGYSLFGMLKVASVLNQGKLLSYSWPPSR